MFHVFKQALRNHFESMLKDYRDLYVVDFDKEALWNTYLMNFPESERQEHNCNCCRQFIKNFGGIVCIDSDDFSVTTIWDIPFLDEPFASVAKAMSDYIKSNPIRCTFIYDHKKMGTDSNLALAADGSTIRWEHLYCELPDSKIFKDRRVSIASKEGELISSKSVFKRALDEISQEAIEIVLDLINQKALYRGEEFQSNLNTFLNIKKLYAKVPTDKRDNWCWLTLPNNIFISHIRNNAIGTLLVDISEGRDLDAAVTAFERIMAPANYKRPKALITKRMIEEAQKTVAELGIEDSLARRHASISDITVNNVLFLNRNAKKALNVFDALKEDVKVNPQKLSKVTEVGIEEFLKNILPNSEGIELLMENRLIPNLVTLTAPVNPEAKSIFKWKNNFGWSYNGNIADSGIKEKVTSYGGNVNGELRISIGWLGLTDLDLHVIEPGGHHIYYSYKNGHGGRLDLDMNGLDKASEKPVENVIYTDKNAMKEGRYKAYVNTFRVKGTNPEGFEAEIECQGKVYHFSHTYEGKRTKSGENVTIAEFEYSRKDGVKLISSLPETNSDKEVWGITTNKFQKVSIMMMSPNYWDGQVGIGNKHYFFMLEGCKNPDSVRGFFNEYLSPELTPHRKVFEALGSKMVTPYNEDQLSGLGFSSTVRNSVICKVLGTFERIIKVNF